MITFLLHIFFFFSSRRRHTRYWRDWSSDVCSSDLTFTASPAKYEPQYGGFCSNGAPYAVKLGSDPTQFELRSEERRVGKECRSGWWACHLKKKRWRWERYADIRGRLER